MLHCKIANDDTVVPGRSSIAILYLVDYSKLSKQTNKKLIWKTFSKYKNEFVHLISLCDFNDHLQRISHETLPLPISRWTTVSPLVSTLGTRHKMQYWGNIVYSLLTGPPVNHEDKWVSQATSQGFQIHSSSLRKCKVGKDLAGLEEQE